MAIMYCTIWFHSKESKQIGSKNGSHSTTQILTTCKKCKHGGFQAFGTDLTQEEAPWDISPSREDVLQDGASENKDIIRNAQYKILSREDENTGGRHQAPKKIGRQKKISIPPMTHEVIVDPQAHDSKRACHKAKPSRVKPNRKVWPHWVRCWIISEEVECTTFHWYAWSGLQEKECIHQPNCWVQQAAECCDDHKRHQSNEFQLIGGSRERIC